MNKRGKIATLGIMIVYLLASIWGLYVVYTEFFASGVDEEAGYAVGDYQGALLAAYGRADAKRFYLEHAAMLAIEEAGDELYESPQRVLDVTEGDDQSSCDSYVYPFLQSCLNPLELPVLFGDSVLAHMDSQGLAYTAMVEPRLVWLRSGTIEEPILYGVQGENADDIAATLEGTSITQGLSWPSQDSRGVNSCFGPRTITHGSRLHRGLDINGQNRVLAAADGTVIGMDPQASSQGTVWIQHSPSLSTRSLHLIKSTITVKPGDTVKRGQYLGTAAHTGCWQDDAKTKPCGDHLHFEVLINTPQESSHAYNQDSTPGWQAVNPVCFFDADALDKVSLTNIAYSCQDDSNWRTEWCREYSFTLTDAQAYQPGTSLGVENGTVETTEQPAVGEDVVRPDNTGLTVKQQAKFATTEQNRYAHKWDGHVVAASAKYGVDQALILGVITQESLGDPLAISPTGCAGLMQICYETGKNLPGLGADRMTPCRCAGKGPSCQCNVENDYRLHADVAVPAGVFLLQENLQRFSHYTEQVAFAVGAYNIGPGIIQQAINGVGSDPSWKQVAAYMDDHPELVDAIAWYRDKPVAMKQKKIDEVNGYVPAVLAYTAAWNGGVALAARPGFEDVRGVKRIGTYTYEADLMIETVDMLTPYTELHMTIDELTKRCARDRNPTECLVENAADLGWYDCEAAPVQYFVDLYESLRDCVGNEQTSCQCALPVPVAGNLTFSLDADERYATLAGYDRLLFSQLSNKTIRIGAREGVVPAVLELSMNEEGVGLSYQELVGSDDDVETILWDPGWVVEKNGEHIVFREDATGVGQCAPVKTSYSYCADLVEGKPPARFAVTLLDDLPASPPIGLAFDGTFVSYSPSFSEDVSFYNVYTEQPWPDTVPVLQTTAERFDATAWIGETLYVSAVDKAGQEGAAGTILIN